MALVLEFESFHPRIIHWGAAGPVHGQQFTHSPHCPHWSEFYLLLPLQALTRNRFKKSRRPSIRIRRPPGCPHAARPARAAPAKGLSRPAGLPAILNKPRPVFQRNSLRRSLHRPCGGSLPRIRRRPLARLPPPPRRNRRSCRWAGGGGRQRRRGERGRQRRRGERGRPGRRRSGPVLQAAVLTPPPRRRRHSDTSSQATHLRLPVARLVTPPPTPTRFSILHGTRWARRITGDGKDGLLWGALEALDRSSL